MDLRGVLLVGIAQGLRLMDRPRSQTLSVFMAEQENVENSQIGH